MVSASQPRSHDSVCGADCFLPPVVCKILTCGSFKVNPALRLPLELLLFALMTCCMGTQVFANSSATRGSTTVTGSDSGTVLANLEYGETVTVTCDADHRLHDQACDQEQFSVKCDQNGSFSYTGSFSSSTAATDLRCERKSCSISAIDATNGEVNASNGKVETGQVANLTCHPGYRLHASGTGTFSGTGTYPVPADSSNVHSFQCRNNCTFETLAEVCTRQGCTAKTFTTTDLVATPTVDPLVTKGARKEGETVVVTCPKGYHVDSDAQEPASSTAESTAESTCHCNNEVPPVCEHTPVNCSRVSCAVFTVIIVMSYGLLCAAFARKRIANARKNLAF